MKGMREFIWEEDGMGTVEIILIIVVLVGLVIIFKSQITQIINSLFQKITSQTGESVSVPSGRMPKRAGIAWRGHSSGLALCREARAFRRGMRSGAWP